MEEQDPSKSTSSASSVHEKDKTCYFRENFSFSKQKQLLLPLFKLNETKIPEMGRLDLITVTQNNPSRSSFPWVKGTIWRKCSFFSTPQYQMKEKWSVTSDGWRKNLILTFNTGILSDWWPIKLVHQNVPAIFGIIRTYICKHLMLDWLVKLIKNRSMLFLSQGFILPE